MSHRRVVSIGNIDLDRLQEICEMKGHKVKTHTGVRLYGGATEQCDLVVNDRIGFRRNELGVVEAVYDDMYTEQYAKIMADFVEEYTDGNIHSGYHVVARTEDSTFITLRVAR